MKITFDILCIFALIFLIFLAIIFKIMNKKGTYFTINENMALINNNLKKSISKTEETPKTRKNVSKGEQKCCEILEKIFNVPFKTKRPDFLNNPIGTGYNLELDCFNPKLKIGLEYNGRQHYEFVPYFQKNYESFENQKYKDYVKRELCKKNGIFLITIPYTVPLENIEEEILKQLRNKK